MWNTLTRIAGCAFLCAISLVPAVAKADPVVGSYTISGDAIFTNQQITFNNSALDYPIVNSASVAGVNRFNAVTLAPMTYNLLTQTATLNYNDVAGKVLFTTTSASGVTFSLMIGQLDQLSFTPANTTSPTFLNISGTGTYRLTGYTDTLGTFKLTATSTSGGNSSFTLNGTVPVAPSPEPSSLLLLGTGMLGAGAVMMRRHRRIRT